MFRQLRHLQCSLKVSNQRSKPFSTVVSGAKELYLAGTVPFHSAYLFLHAKQSPQTFPKKLESDLYLQLKNEASKWDERCLVNMRYDSSTVEERDSPNTSGEEEFQATLHVGRLETHELSITSSSFESALSLIKSRIQSARNPSDSPTLIRDSRRLYLYVCTHTAVDCRCGDNGPKFVEALKKELERLKKEDLLKDRYWQDVKVMETGHVGGHK
jgi:hypothetical protein